MHQKKLEEVREEIKMLKRAKREEDYTFKEGMDKIKQNKSNHLKFKETERKQEIIK